MAAELGCRVATTLQEAAEEGGLQCALICTPTPSHLQDIKGKCRPATRKIYVSKAAADLGLDIFVEKPVCVAEEDIAAAYDYCEERGVKLYCGFHRRFDPALRQFQQKMSDPAWGPAEVLALTAVTPTRCGS